MEGEERGDFFVIITARADDYYKGTFLGLRGFAEFCQRVPGARLIVTTWGNDIALAKEVVAKLGILDRTLFVPVAGKRKLIDYLRSADCIVDQFRVGYFGSTALEAAACGVPVIMRFEHAQYDSLCETGAPPFLNAASSNEVADALEMLASSPSRRAENSDANRRWFLDNFSGARWWPELKAVLGALALGHRFSFAGSPLNAQLSPVECLYHAEQRLRAPPFPQYEVPISQFAQTFAVTRPNIQVCSRHPHASVRRPHASTRHPHASTRVSRGPLQSWSCCAPRWTTSSKELWGSPRPSHSTMPFAQQWRLPATSPIFSRELFAELPAGGSSHEGDRWQRGRPNIAVARRCRMRIESFRTRAQVRDVMKPTAPLFRRSRDRSSASPAWIPAG